MKVSSYLKGFRVLVFLGELSFGLFDPVIFGMFNELCYGSRTLG
jgi:hypothetical protein